jgi:hypothetical protein
MTRLYRPLPTASLLWELFYYKPLTGELVWKKQLSARSKVGSIAGTLTGKGAYEIQINTNKYLAHRLIWVWVTGIDLTTSLLDHKNRNPRDNRFWNLRVATQSQNMSNVTHTNPTGYKGVQRKGTRFTARIRIDSKVTYLGSFGTAAEAGAAYERAAVRLYGDFACLQARPSTVA